MLTRLSIGQDPIETLLDRQRSRDIEFAASMLRKLKVAELRVLYRHYFKISGDDIPKYDLVEEIAPEYALQELGLDVY